MKKILMAVITILITIISSCDKNIKVDVSDLNEEMLNPRFCELTSRGFVGVIFNNYLCYGPNSYVPNIEIPSKNEFENGEYINSSYKLEYQGNTYVVSNGKLQIYNDDIDFHFDYEKNDETLIIKYYLPEFNFSYKETMISNNIKIELNWKMHNGDSDLYEIYIYDDYFEVVYGYYSPAFYIVKEVYNLDGIFTYFVVEYGNQIYKAYPLSSYGLTEKYVDNIICLVDKNGNLFKSYHCDDKGVTNEILDYQNKTKFIMIREDLIPNQFTDIKDLLISYTPLVLDDNSTSGLQYQQIKDSDEYEFYGMGTSTSTVNIVSSKVNGQNVTRVAEGVDVFGNYSSNFVFLDYPVEIYLPDTIQKIGKYAFANGDKLTKIIIPNSCTEIGKAAFYGCNMLEEVTLPDNLISLENNTFTKCTKLKNVYIPKNLEQIGAYVFENCESLKELNFGGTVAQWEELTKYVKDRLYINTFIERVICSNGIIEIK